MVPKRELTFVLPYLGKLSLDLRARLRRTIEKDLSYCKLKIMFRSKCRLNTLFRFKDSLKKEFALESFIVIRIVSARLVTIGKPSANFISERLNT